MKYKITFEDNSIFDGSSVNGSWNRIPNKRIKKLEYFLGKQIITLEGFEAYNHIVRLGFGVNNSIKGIIAIILMGKKEDKVHRRIFDFRRKKIRKDIVDWGKEYCDRPHHLGWKEGI